MHILFVGKCSPTHTINAIIQKTGKNPGIQIVKFSRLILEGFVHNNNKVNVISNIITEQAIFSRHHEECFEDIQYTYLPTIQVPILCQLFYILSSFIYTIKWALRTKGDKIILCDIFANSSSKGSVAAAKLLNIPKCMMLTDMIAPPVTIAKDTSKWWWNTFFKMRVRSQHNSIKQYDGFVFLTQYMNNKYNPLQKPYIVMEGSVDYKFKSQPILPTHASRVVMYAGAVEAEYGFDTLLKAFMELPIKDVKLHIYGDGKFIKQLLAYQEQDARIKYMGVVSNEEIIQAEQQATILVNPRLSNQELVKYSFPSKTTEYMLSGTPVLTTKLCGIPEEYYPHLYTFDEESVEGFKNKLLETLSLTNDELRQKGLDAQRFVLENKNNIKQAQRVEQFFEEIIANNRK